MKWLAPAKEVAVVAAVAVASSAMALQFLGMTLASRQYFFDWELVPATMMACGRGFSEPAQPVPSLTAFVLRARPGFDCGALPPGAPLIGANQIALVNRYGLIGPMLAMRIGGVTWQSLDRYVAALYGLATVITYALFRLVAGRPVAALGTALLACSTKLQQVVSHRDYIKEPPFLALVFVAAWMALGARTRGQLLLASLAGGLLLGFGIGCRIDVLIIGPFFLCSLLAFVRWPAGAGWKARVASVALFIAGFAATGGPILRSASGGSNFGHTVLLGFGTSFTRALGLDVPVYDVGEIYSDGYAYTLITAQVRAREQNLAPLPFGLSAYDRAGERLDTDILMQFPADTIARGYGAVIQALAFPLSHDAIRDSGVVAGFRESRWLKWPAAWRESLLTPLAGGGVWLTLAAILIVAAFDVRMAFFCTAALAYFCGYSMLQFQRRHWFHLDVFSMLAAAFLAQVVVAAAIRLAQRPRARVAIPPVSRAARNVGVYLLVTATLVVVPLAIARARQQRHVASMIEETLAAARETVRLEPMPLGDGRVLVSSQDLGERAAAAPDDPRDVRMDYVVVEFSGPACGSEAFPVHFKYTGVVRTLDKEFDREWRVVPPSSAAGPFRLLSPLFYEYGPYWTHFDGIILPESRLACLTAVRRVSRPGALPFPFLYAALEPGWAGSPLYQRFNMARVSP